MGQRSSLSPVQIDEVWSRWRSGQAVKVLSRQMRIPASTTRDLLRRTGGIRPSPRHRAPSRLTVAEREEISRGLAAGTSLRAIAATLRRAPSTIYSWLRALYAVLARFRSYGDRCRGRPHIANQSPKELGIVFFHDYASWSQGALAALAGIAQPDEWEYRRTTTDRPWPILRNYVVYTFRRAYFQGRVIEIEDGDGSKHAAFNTGLLTPHFETIYGYFVEQTAASLPQPWYLSGFHRESDHRLLRFQKLPDRASYFDDPSDLLYDPRLDLRIQYEHIVNDNVDRFPSNLQQDERGRVEAVRQAVAHAEFRVQQNYKAAIPQYYWPPRADDDAGKLQLLLPLCLQDVNRADLALSVDKVGSVYRAATVLTLDMAYNNARLIARPDKEWLEPIPARKPDASIDEHDQSAPVTNG